MQTIHPSHEMSPWLSALVGNERPGGTVETGRMRQCLRCHLTEAQKHDGTPAARHSRLNEPCTGKPFWKKDEQNAGSEEQG